MGDAQRTLTSIAELSEHWIAAQRKHLGYGLSGIGDLSWPEWGHGLATGLTATADAVSFGASGRVADLVGAEWYDDYRRELGYGMARILAAAGRDAAIVAYPGIASRGIPWARGALKGAVQGSTDAMTGAITIRAGIEGAHLERVVRHEQLHSFAIQHMPAWARDLTASWYKRKGLWRWFEEASAEFYATGRPLHAVRYPFVRPYLDLAVVQSEAWSLVKWGLLTAGIGLIRGDEVEPPEQSSAPTGVRLGISCSTGQSDLLPQGGLGAGRFELPPQAPAPKPMDTVRHYFAGRLDDAGPGLFGTRFVIDGVAVSLTERQASAKVDDLPVTMTDAPELRGGHLSLTPAAARELERAIDSAVDARSVHRWFVGRLTRATGQGDKAMLTIDGIEVALRHNDDWAEVAGRLVRLPAKARRARGNMTIDQGSVDALNTALLAAKLAAATKASDEHDPMGYSSEVFGSPTKGNSPPRFGMPPLGGLPLFDTHF